MISRKLFGPPGTGKTTKLLKYVKTFLKLGTPVDKIGYFAFTKKAANEAIDSQHADTGMPATDSIVLCYYQVSQIYVYYHLKFI